MMQVTIRLTDNRMRNLPGNLRKAGADLVKRTAAAIEGQAKVLCPVDTGALRNSIMVTEKGEMSAEVGPHMEYGGYIEWGTVHMAAQPYLTPAAEGARPAWEAGLRELFNE
jgi:HK97 gp10 family phage protein